MGSERGDVNYDRNYRPPVIERGYRIGPRRVPTYTRDGKRG